jgi:apolipoprotein N-acyltransferase
MNSGIEPPTGHRQVLRALSGGLVGALAGFGCALLLYQWIDLMLEARNDWLEEWQGFLFNIVPLGIAVGAALGWWVIRHFDQRA